MIPDNSVNKFRQENLIDKSIKKILIVDDDPLILEGFSNALHKVCNFQGEIKTAENGKDAIDEISLCSYDICFLDINLPDLNGLDVMKKIKEISPDTSVAIVSGDIIDDNKKRKIEERASLFIPKPIDLSQIKAFVEQELEGRDFYGEQKCCREGYINEKRKFERRPFIKTINYSVKLHKSSNVNADIIDISTEGVGIRTDYLLEPGHVLRFKKGMGHEAGIVKWSMMVVDAYRVGIKFVKK